MGFLSDLFNPKPKAIQRKQEVLTKGDCPYCNEVLEPAPTRKKKCPHCEKTVIVRTHYKTKKKILLTEGQVKKFDVEKEKHYTVTSFLRGLANFGIEKRLIDSLVTKHTDILEKKFGKEPSFADAAWGVSNKLITKYPDLSRGIHFQQAFFLHNEGKDPTKIRLIEFEIDLKEYQQSEVVRKVEVISAGEQSCEHCRLLGGQKFTIKEALEQKILPCKECSYEKNEKGVGWCRCCYGPVV